MHWIRRGTTKMATSQGCCCKPKQPTELPASLRWILPKKSTKKPKIHFAIKKLSKVSLVKIQTTYNCRNPEQQYPEVSQDKLNKSQSRKKGRSESEVQKLLGNPNKQEPRRWIQINATTPHHSGQNQSKLYMYFHSGVISGWRVDSEKLSDDCRLFS